MNLLEGAKISQSLLKQALNDPDFTMGIEAEFFLMGGKSLIRKHMTQDTETMDLGGGEHFVKKLGDVSWHDVAHFFAPLGVSRHEIKHNHEIMRDRVLGTYMDVTGEDMEEAASVTPEEAWTRLQQDHRVHELMAMMRIFPDHRMMGVPDEQARAIRDIVYDGNVEEIAPFGKLNEVPIALAEVGYEHEDLDPNEGHATRDAFYNLVAKDLSKRLGVRVVYTTDSNLTYHVSNEHEHWVITEDSSLEETEKMRSATGEPTDIIGMELVSPIMSAQEGMEMLDRVLQVLNEDILGLQVVTTSKTGLHVNLGVRNKEIDPVKVLVLSGDEYMTQKFDRMTNVNASSIQAALKDRMMAVVRGETPVGISSRELVAAASQVLKDFKPDQQDLTRAIETLNRLKPEGKQHSINFQKLASGYVEYRQIGNKNYHKRRQDIRNAVLHMIGMTYIATDPDAYRQEFLKKLYSIIQQSVQDALKVPLAASVGPIGRQPGKGGGVNEPPDAYEETPFDGEHYLTKYGFDAGSDTQ